MEPRVKAWIVFPGGTKFGAGRAELLRRIEATGSLQAAVAGMGMSYRAAWGYLRELETAAGFPFLERGGPGSRLTERARAFLAGYEAFHGRLDASANRAFRGAFRRTRGRARTDAGRRRRTGS